MAKLAGFIGVMVFSALLGLGCSKFEIRPAYVPVGEALGDVGKGARVRLLVADDRLDKLSLGVTQDIYKRRIEWDRPAVIVVEDGLRQALSRAGYVIADDAPAAVDVHLVDARVVWAAEFFNKIQANVSLDVRVVSQDGRAVGSKRYADSGWEKQGLGSDGAPEGTHALSVVLSRAIEKAVSDPMIRELVDKATVPAGKSSGAGTKQTAHRMKGRRPSQTSHGTVLTAR